MGDIGRRVWLMAPLLVCATVLGHAGERKTEQRGSRPQQRNFYQQRQYPLGFIPARALLKARQQVANWRTQLAPQAAGNVAQTTAAAQMWTEIGPRPLIDAAIGEVSGRVTALAIDPTNDAVVYLGAADGGVWKTVDGGTHWTPLTDAQPSLSVGSIAVAPSNAKVVYVGLGEESFDPGSYGGMGVLKSTDGGASWTLRESPFYGPFGSSPYDGGAHIGALAVHATNPDLVLAAVEMRSAAKPGDRSGIWRSSDGGSTWKIVLSGAPGTEVVFDPLDVNTVYAALGKGPTWDVAGAWGVYKSNDAGATWTPINSGLPASASPGRIALAVQHTSGSAAILYAGIADAAAATYGNLLGLYKSSNAGATWSRVANAPPYCAPQCWYANVLSVDPSNSNRFFAGGSAGNSLYRSLDGGQTWTPMLRDASGVMLHDGQRALRFTRDGAVLYIGNDGGAWKAANPAGAFSYTNLNRTLGTIQFNPGVSIADANTAYAGTQDNGTIRYRGSNQWERMEVCSDGGYTAVDPRNAATVYAACAYVSPRRSLDGGTTWFAADHGINTKDDSAFMAPFAVDPLAPDTLYFGTYRLWRTTIATATWYAASGDLSKGTGNISAIAVAPTNSAWVYVATDDGNVQVTYDVTKIPAVWNLRTAGLPNRAVTSIAIAASGPGAAYVTFSGFSYGADTLGHVFKTGNAGLNWTDISIGLPNAPANDIVIDPDIPGTLYVATDVGVFRSIDGGQSWAALGAGLPNSAVVALRLHRASRILWAATHGRGMWLIAVPVDGISVSPPIVDSGLRDGSLSAVHNATGSPQAISAGAVNAPSVGPVDPAHRPNVGTRRTAGQK